MRLVHLDIDHFDAQNSIHLGPLAAGLNAVCGPQSSGKTTISRFVRAMMYPNERTSLDRHPVDYRRSKGSMAWVDQAGVHRTYSHHLHDEPVAESRSTQGYWADRTAYIGSEHRAWDTIPVEAYDAIYSGRLGEIAIERLWQAAKRIGVQGHFYTKEDLTTDRFDTYRDPMVDDQRGKSYWQNERARLVARLADIDLAYTQRTTYTQEVYGHPVRRRLDLIRSEILSLKNRERDLEEKLSGDVVHSVYHSTPTVASESTDRQLVQWRQTLEEVRSQREQLERISHDIHWDLQVGHRVDSSRNIRSAIDRLEAQVVASRQSLANLFADFKVRNSFAPIDVSVTNILRRLQEDLYRVSEQLSQNKPQSAIDLLQSQVAQLKRCEHELNESLDRQSHAVGRITAAAAGYRRSYQSESYDSLRAELSRVRARLASAVEESKLAEREAHQPVSNIHRMELAAERAEVLRQLQNVDTVLADLDRDPYKVYKTRTVTQRETLERTLLPKADRYVRELTGGAIQRLPSWAIPQGVSRDAIGCSVCSPTLDTNLIRNSSHEERQLVELSLRLAIIESARDAQVCDLPLILDNAFESFDGDLLERVICVLDHFAQRGHQIVLLTRDEMVARSVESTHGCVCQLRPYQSLNPVRYVRQVAIDYVAPQVSVPAVDIAEVNRRLAALAAEYEAEQAPVVEPVVRVQRVSSPYFLKLTSRIEEAPSLIPVTVDRLKNRGVYEVGQFMECEPHEVVGWLHDLGVEEADVGRWQSECDLMCHVPHLRAFDARVLVGCGIASPKMLRTTHPNQLATRVEAFLATPRGRDILRTASRSELTKLAAWLKSAGRDRAKVVPTVLDDEQDVDLSVSSSSDSFPVNDQVASYSFSGSQRNGSARPASSRNDESKSSGNGRSSRSTTKSQKKPKARSGGSNVVRMQPSSSSTSANGSLRFYLDLDSPIVDAPSIGDSVAEHLIQVGIRTVQQLLVADAVDLVSQLNLPRISSTEIEQWQQQATLVCRVPNLRGHDAQLLVAANVVSAEQLSLCNPSDLLASVSEIANSKFGQRILRNSKAPDLAEVTDWINWSKSSRIIRAA